MNGYFRLALFKFLQTHQPSMLFDAEKRNCLERIINFVASVCSPMFLRVHLKPRASDGSENAIFSRDFLLFFNQQDQHWCAKPSKSAFANILQHSFAFPLSAVLAAEQSLPMQVRTHEMLHI